MSQGTNDDQSTGIGLCAGLFGRALMNSDMTTSTLLDMSSRDDLRKLIVDLAVVHGRVVLSSGREADHYVDLRRVTLHHAAAPLIGAVMLDTLGRLGIRHGRRADPRG